MSRRGWFKHFNNESQSTEMQTLFARQEHEAAVLLWILKEQFNQKQSPFISISIAFLSRLINKRKKKIIYFISVLNEVYSDFYFDLNESETDLKFSIYRESLMTSRAFVSESPPKTGPPPNKMIDEKMKDDKKILKKEFNKGLTFETDLERIAELYPRTDGLAGGIAEAKFTIKTHHDLVALDSAIKNYKKHLEQNRTEFKFIKTFKNFIRDDYWKAFIKTSTPGESFDDSMAEYDRLLKERGIQ